jgi:hypothetical protein
MTSYLIVTRVAIILWINLAVMPAALAFDANEAELERNFLQPQQAGDVAFWPA